MYLVVSKVKQRAKDAGKRVGKDFLMRLDAFIDRKMVAALAEHNGGKKTLDGAMADYILGTK
jgi:hypothetical protein